MSSSLFSQSSFTSKEFLMGRYSRVCLARIVAAALMCGMPKTIEGAEANKREEETHVIIELPYNFYARTFALRTWDSKEAKDLTGSFGLGHRLGSFFFDIGASYPLFNEKKWIGTIKPYVRIQKDIQFFRNQTLTPSIQLDVTPSIHENETTMFFHNMGVRHVWKPYDTLSVEQSFALGGINGDIVTRTYSLNAIYKASEHIMFELPRFTFVDDAYGADAMIGIQLKIK
jgi:hypothetical protein